MGQTIGYIRVSTVEQNEARQVEALEQYGVDKNFIDKVSGKDTKRPQLQAMLDYIREGDTLVVAEYSRLARNTIDLLEIVQGLRAKGVVVKSLKENFDTSSAHGELMLTMLAGFAQFERTMIKERQAEGIAIAKAEGKYKGRVKVKKPKQWNEWYDLYKARQMTGSELIKKCVVSRATVYKWIKEME